MVGPGSTLGDRYLLHQRIASGGMGDVWRAEDTVLGRTVAVKVLRPALVADPGFAARFRAEARTMAAISHPGIIDVYDYGHADDVAYLVMQYVEGEPLSALLEQFGRLAPDHTMRIVAQAADALHAAHVHGIVHRDVKPANLLIRPDGRLALSDFGIALSPHAEALTDTGEMMGTASYLAPEQVAGEAVGPPADVYALGLVLLECLTGEREYAGSTVEVALARLHRQPEVPDTLPDGWPGLLRAMTAREPDDRPLPAEAAAELDAIAAGGQATTVLATPMAAPPVADRTQVLSQTRVAPVPAAPRERVAPRPVAAPPRDNWPWVLALLAIVALIAAGAVYASQERGETGPLPAVEADVPEPLRGDVERLQDAVGG